MDNLCFKVKGLQGKVETINISSSFTFNDLYELIANKFNIQDPESFDLLSVQSYFLHLSLLLCFLTKKYIIQGFPPVVIGEASREDTLEGNITSNTMLILRLHDSNASNKPFSSSSSSTKTKSKAPSTKSITTKANRQTTKSATTSFASLNNTSNKPLSSSSSSLSSPHIVPLNRNSSNLSRNRPQVTTQISRTGDIIHTTVPSRPINRYSSRPKRTRRNHRQPTAGSQDDIADHLIEAVNGASGKRSESLRKVSVIMMHTYIQCVYYIVTICILILHPCLLHIRCSDLQFSVSTAPHSPQPVSQQVLKAGTLSKKYHPSEFWGLGK